MYKVILWPTIDAFVWKNSLGTFRIKSQKGGSRALQKHSFDGIIGDS